MTLPASSRVMSEYQPGLILTSLTGLSVDCAAGVGSSEHGLRAACAQITSERRLLRAHEPQTDVLGFSGCLEKRGTRGTSGQTKG